MTTEERFDKIETGLQRVVERLDRLTERMGAFEVSLEVQNHAFNERVNKLWEAHTAIMDSQNHAWEAIGKLSSQVSALGSQVSALGSQVSALGGTVSALGGTVDRMAAKVDKLSDTVDAFIRGLHRPNGNL